MIEGSYWNSVAPLLSVAGAVLLVLLHHLYYNIYSSQDTQGRIH